MNDFYKNYRFEVSNELKNFHATLLEYSSHRKLELEQIKERYDLPIVLDSVNQKVILKKDIEDFESKIQITKKNIEVLEKDIASLERQYSVYESIKRDANSFC